MIKPELYSEILVTDSQSAYLLSLRLLEEELLDAVEEAALDWEHWTQLVSVMMEIRMLQCPVLIMTMMMMMRSGARKGK